MSSSLLVWIIQHLIVLLLIPFMLIVLDRFFLAHSRNVRVFLTAIVSVIFFLFMLVFFFFFQAEDGILFLIVTGVQTCALPI